MEKQSPEQRSDKRCLKENEILNETTFIPFL